MEGGSNSINITASSNSSNSRSTTVTISNGNSSKKITVNQREGIPKVSVYVDLRQPQNPASNWYWSDGYTGQSGDWEFDAPIVIRNISSLSIQPNCDYCQITIVMGTTGDSDYVTGVSGDFTGVEFNKFQWDVRDQEKRGKISVSGQTIDLQIAERI